MNDDFKNYIQLLIDNKDKIIHLPEIDIHNLLDYITNLQQENERLIKHNEKLYKKDSGIIENLNQELERTQQKWEEERHFTICRTKEWLDYKSRIEKAVEYIENTPLYEITYDYNIEEELEIQNVSDETASNKLLNILNGKE